MSRHLVKQPGPHIVLTESNTEKYLAEAVEPFGAAKERRSSTALWPPRLNLSVVALVRTALGAAAGFGSTFSTQYSDEERTKLYQQSHFFTQGH